MDLSLLNRTLHHDIPLSEILGIQLLSYQQQCLIATAPLAPNINHKRTAFGGSLYSIAVLTGWALVNLRLHEADPDLQQRAQVVIYHCEMDYLDGVDADFSARVSQSQRLKSERFIQGLLRHGKSSCVETIEVLQANETKARLMAKYVVLLPQQ